MKVVLKAHTLSNSHKGRNLHHLWIMRAELNKWRKLAPTHEPANTHTRTTKARIKIIFFPTTEPPHCNFTKMTSIYYTTPKVIHLRSRCWVKWQLQSLTCDEVAALEGLCKLLGVFVLAVPDWVALTVKVLPEVGNCYRQGVLVGILSLELVHDKCAKKEKGRKGERSGHISAVCTCRVERKTRCEN